MNKAIDLKYIEARRLRSSVAMSVLIVSWAMFFATLFLAYFVYRVAAPSWPPMGILRPNLTTPILSTLWVCLSSISFYLFEKATCKALKVQMKKFLSLTLFFAVLFMMSQFQLWKQLKLAGLFVEQSTFASILYGFTWIHFAHMLLGISGLIWLGLFVRKFSGQEHEVKSLLVKNLGIFWHFLTIVWILMFIILFVV